MEITEVNFYNICRTCKGESEDMIPIFNVHKSDTENARIDEMLMACASVQVDLNDGLPSVMCHNCSEHLKSAFKFKQQCERIDKSFRESLKDKLIVKEEAQISELEIANTVAYSDLKNLFDDNEASNSSHNGGDSLTNIKEELDSSLVDSKSDSIEFLENNQLILTCRDCSKVFTTLEGLRCHKRLHTGAMFECKTCGKEYTRQNHLQRHELSHCRRKVHVCKICNKTLTRFEHLKRHLAIHLKEKPFTCQSCSRGFNRNEHLINHLQRCKGELLFICDICNKSFNRKDSLEVHKHLHENKMPVLPTIDTLDNIEEHYYEIDHDGTSVFSDVSDNDGETGETMEKMSQEKEADADASLEPGIEEEMTVTTETEKNCESSQINETISNNEISNTELSVTLLPEKLETVVDDYQVENDEPNGSCLDAVNDSDSSTHSEYLPFKKNFKRGPGRPRKNSILVYKPTGRPRGRPRIKQEPNENEGETIGAFPCTVCLKVFETESLLKRHGRKHDNKEYRCSVCDKQFSRSNHLKRHMSSHSENKPFVCETCAKCFTRRDHLTQHIRLHTRSKYGECDICKQPFARADHLAKHMASKHNIGEKIMGEKKFKCLICMKGFTTEKYRDVHMKGHSGEKKFQCKTCQKTFISKSHLTEHIKFHNDNSKKFLCSECGQRFIRNDYLVIHMRRHRGEKPFKCKYCGKGFPRTTDLTVHERYHTGEKTHLCTICGRGFGRAYNLTVHMRTHTGEKPYQCTYCDAAFAQGNDLKAHVRRHTGERFQCELCTESFLMGYLLTQHKRTIHGLNVVSNIRRLQPINKINNEPNPDEPEPVTIPLPTPVIPNILRHAQVPRYSPNYIPEEIMQEKIN